MRALNIGDVVRLKSGGPKMTVGSVWVSGSVTCQWMPVESLFHTNSGSEHYEFKEAKTWAGVPEMLGLVKASQEMV